MFKKVFLVMFFILISRVCVAAQAHLVREGNRLFEEMKYEQAEEKYAEALKINREHDITNFNMGVALYKQDHFQRAQEYFQKALLTDSDELRQKVYYNLGNVFFKKGIQKENTKINEAIQNLEGSLKHFKSALIIEAQDEDAQYNYEFVANELRRLKEKEQQQRDSPSGPKSEKDQSHDSKQQPSQEDQPEERGMEKGEDQQGEHGQQKAEEGSEGYSPEREDSSWQDMAQERASNFDIDEWKGMRRQEAEALLSEYQQTEDPGGLLFLEIRNSELPVLKDW